jgi:hypothetical protein
MTAATTIRDQIGRKALAMLGAYDLVAFDTGLQLKIRGSRKVNVIRVTLDPTDTYTVKFSRWQPKRMVNTAVADFSHVHADELNELIERTTGLYTSL